MVEIADELPRFEPPGWLRGGHAQTIVGRYWPNLRPHPPTTSHELTLPDGDRLLLLESTPAGWNPSRPSAMLVHGLAGCSGSAYVVRLTDRLFRSGIRVIRVNLRGAGRGFGMSRGIYHAGRSDDLGVVVDWMRDNAPDSPVATVGFSLGANLVLRLAAEAGPKRLACVVAANPPIDLAACARRMCEPENRLYDWNFVRWLRSTVGRLHQRFPDLGPTGLDGVRTLYEFDDRYTARRNGFASAEDYYQRCSLVATLGQIEVPGLIVHAMDDPFVPHEPFLHAERRPSLKLELVAHGGHLGYVSRRPWQGDRRWLETRILSFVRLTFSSRGVSSGRC